MGLEKGILYGKEKRKPYFDSRRFDFSCRNHKGCPWCESSRLRKQKQIDQIAEEQLNEYQQTSD